LWSAMGDDGRGLGWAMRQQVIIRRVGGCGFQGGGDGLRLRQVMVCLQAGGCGQPMQAQVGQEQPLHMQGRREPMLITTFPQWTAAGI
jgi:hypothetical protein